MVEKSHYKFFLLYIDQIFIFQKCRHNSFTKTPITTDYEILYILTEQEWDIFLNSYIYDELQNQLTVQTNIGSSPCMEEYAEDASL